MEMDRIFTANEAEYPEWSIGFFLNIFTEFRKFNDKRYLSLKGLKSLTSCVRDQDATTLSASPIHASVIYRIP